MLKALVRIRIGAFYWMKFSYHGKWWIILHLSPMIVIATQKE